MKKDNISQLDDYDVPICEQQYMYGSCYNSLFKFKSFGQLINPPPQISLNFRHLLSCSTIETVPHLYFFLIFTKCINLHVNNIVNNILIIIVLTIFQYNM